MKKPTFINFKILGYKLFISMMFLFYFDCSYARSTINTTLQQFIDNYRINNHLPAAVLSVNFPNNKTITVVSGTVQNESFINPNPKLVTPDNLFQIGSITKSFTAVIILQLESEGRLSINNTLADIAQQYGQFLPKNEYDAWKNISIKQLLNMTSGIFDVTEDTDFINILAKTPKRNWMPQEIIAYAYKHKPYFSPGLGWHYSNTNYNILELLIQTITKHSFEDEINQRILKKYSLNHTYYLPYQYPTNIINRMAHGYAYIDGGFSPPILSGSDMTYANMSAAGASGALVSNSKDVTRWVRLLFTGKILPTFQYNELLSVVCQGTDNTCRPGEPLSQNSHSEGYSLGLVRLYDPQWGIIWAYVGGTPGYYSAFMWLQEKNIALAMTVSATTMESKKILRSLAQAAKLI